MVVYIRRELACSAKQLGYINDIKNNCIKDSNDTRLFLSSQLKTFVKKNAEKQNHLSIKKTFVYICFFLYSKFYFFFNIQDHIKDSQGHKESYKSNSALGSSKKIRLGLIYILFFLLFYTYIILVKLFFNMQAKTDFIFNISFNEYTNAINAIKSIQQDNKSAHTNVVFLIFVRRIYF